MLLASVPRNRTGQSVGVGSQLRRTRHLSVYVSTFLVPASIQDGANRNVCEYIEQFGLKQLLELTFGERALANKAQELPLPINRDESA